MTCLVRAGDARILVGGDEVVVLGQGDRTQVLSGEGAALARALLDELVEPRTREAIRAFVAEASGQAIEPGGIVDELLDRLMSWGALVETAMPRAMVPPLRRPGPSRVLVALSGAVQSCMAPALIQGLQGRGFEVRVAATRTALRFVARDALEAITHTPVVRSMWSRDPERPVPHLELAEWADVVVVYPASASTVSRLARGDFSDVVAAAALSTKRPVIVAPSMNEAMASAPAVRRNLERLAEDGFLIALPGHGSEVADAPPARPRRRGVAPRPDVVVQLVAFVLARASAAASGDPTAMPTDPAAWDALWTAAPQGGAWAEDTPDGATLEAIAGLIPAASRVLEVGAGSGDLAAALAQRGHHMVASDVSPVALQVAHARHATSPVVLVVDDVTDSRLVGPFDAIVDRACLHAVPAARHPAYATNVARLLRPGGTLALIVDAAAAPAERATHRLDAAAIGALLGGDFTLRETREATLAHRGGRAPAWLHVLDRR